MSHIPFKLRSAWSELGRKGQLSILHIQKCLSYIFWSTFSQTTSLQSALSFVTSHNKLGIQSQSMSLSYISGIQSLSKSHFNHENKASTFLIFNCVWSFNQKVIIQLFSSVRLQCLSFTLTFTTPCLFASSKNELFSFGLSNVNCCCELIVALSISQSLIDNHLLLNSNLTEFFVNAGITL